MIIKKIYSILQNLYLTLFFLFVRRFKYRDKYGLNYYLYKDTRPLDTLRKRVRTDDTTVLDVIKKLLAHLQKSSNQKIECVDVGSYIGIITLLMSKTVGENGRVHSFEPFKDTYDRQLENIRLNANLHNIITNNCAVLDQNLSQIQLNSLDSPGQNYLSVGVNPESKSVKVKTTTLQSYLKRMKVEKVSVCKIDAEGVDHLVLNGLGDYLLQSKVTYFILEFEKGEVKEKIEKILKINNYTIYYMVRNMGFIVKTLEDYPKECKSTLNILAVSNFADHTPVDNLLKKIT
jgi:FkbM family methyltransferase